ncbi:5-formyltetrahydrofolate cyclo-ligase [Bifidobacterium dolichotidis]|nr:5-formyltetrahydrofolate cyclo-ligase [Bifidobacterium dolichotidis]
MTTDDSKNVHKAKVALRHAALERRNSTTREQQHEAGLQLRDVFAQSSLFTNLMQRSEPACIAAFESFGTEIDTEPLLTLLAQHDVRVLVPELGESGRQLSWRWRGQLNAALDPEILEQADLVLVPGLRFDRDGWRLGRGIAWYDRALSYRRSTTAAIGVCWPWEFNSTNADVPHEAHDVPMQAVMTPDGFTMIQQ